MLSDTDLNQARGKAVTGQPIDASLALDLVHEIDRLRDESVAMRAKVEQSRRWARIWKLGACYWHASLDLFDFGEHDKMMRALLRMRYINTLVKTHK